MSRSETRQIRAALSSMTVKTDRNDARGMAHLLRMGWFRPVHLKSLEAREQSARCCRPGRDNHGAFGFHHTDSRLLQRESVITFSRNG